MGSMNESIKLKQMFHCTTTGQSNQQFVFYVSIVCFYCDEITTHQTPHQIQSHQIQAPITTFLTNKKFIDLRKFINLS